MGGGERMGQDWGDRNLGAGDRKAGSILRDGCMGPGGVRSVPG